MAKLKEERKEREKKGKRQKTAGANCSFLKTVFLFLRFYFDLAVDKIFACFYDSQRKFIDNATNPIVLESATSLAQKIRKRELSSEEVVCAFIDRIKEVNSLLNAVVDQRFDEAIKEAQTIDRDIAIGTIIEADFYTKPFLGVPFTSKETTAAKGMSWTFGLVRRKSKKASFDADIVEKMKNAGGILIAVTNIPQLNLWQETNNPIYGTTNNPYNITRNVGGSSGGEGSIIASGGSPMGIGTDIGGSLRIPAFMCGIFGHKPTSNLVSTNGLTFRTGKEKDTMVVAGPLVRYTEDIIPLLKVLVGNNANKLKLDERVNVKDIRIYYVDNPKDLFVSPFRSEMKRIFLKVIDHFSEISSQPPELVQFKQFQFGGKLWRYWMTQEPEANFNRDLANREGEVTTWREIAKFFLRLSEYNLAVIFGLCNSLLPKEKPDWAQEQTKLLRYKLNDLLGNNGVLLYPSAPWPASYHYTAFLRPWNFNLFSIWNVMKFPVTQVPLGLNEDGLPLGIQVVASPYNDHLSIAVAKELEKAFGGYAPPFKIKQSTSNINVFSVG